MTDQADETHELVLERIIGAPPELVWRCWTEEALLKQWFVPKPWRLAEVELELRRGGRFNSVMAGPNGEENRGEGCFLDLDAPHRLVFTDCLTEDFRPAIAPFMVADISFEAVEGGTRYTARVRHVDAETKARHEAMGFHAGWGAAADQLDTLARRLAKA